MTVKVAGAVVPTANWTYDAVGNAVVFQSSSAPRNGDQVQVSYPIGCQ